MQPSPRPKYVFLALIILALACIFTKPAESPLPTEVSAPTQLSPDGTEAIPPPLISPSVSKPPLFAQYEKDAVSLTEAFTGYGLPYDLSNIDNLSPFDLTPDQEALLAQNGFVVAAPVPGQYQEFYQLYEVGRYSDKPLFVTVDSVLHVYHLLFDKILRDLETRFFIPDLEALTTSMIEASQAQLEALKGTSLADVARRNLAFFAVAGRLLELEGVTPPEVADLVEAELSLIEAQSGFGISPIWDREDLDPGERLREDYSQFIPRGHYTRSDDLKRYFKCMMWYGRMTYRLRDAFETQRALLITHALRTTNSADGQPVLRLWQRIFEPTVFLIGKADDLSYFEYAALSDSVFGQNPALETFANQALLDAFLQAAKQLPPPQVNSMWVWIWEDKQEATQGFRFMGQRFTIDAYVFGQMIWRNVGSLDNKRGLPMALDFFAAVGSDEALNILDELGETAYENFTSQMEKVRGELAALEEDTWTENVYWSWLYALLPVIEAKDGRFPEFMRTQAWTRKDLNTALGSFTELKHDTILYAKQIMAELGGGGIDNPPMGYVEPNPEAYARLKALARMTRQGLDERGLLDSRMEGNLDNLVDLLDFLLTVAEKELAGSLLSEDDYFRIMFFGGELEALTIAAADCSDAMSDCRELQDQQAALVADIATGPGEIVLEEAIGQPTHIYVILPDSPHRLAVGAVFTYYEFVVASSERMTDEIWRAKVIEGSTPPAPVWTQSFMSP